ncbi:hypothetical protein FHR61_002774 [Xanthomonas arboricola]|uniref:Uncharacterized protein n=1 Tax=Xanthomonas cannabis TaxID=1885674 RepID=A0ABR6JNF8_9XANT|nr:hypothetical protein [Xanthomonas cannabis]MBB5522919.1 hypothetical protein [Xanthomonas cannabis]
MAAPIRPSGTFPRKRGKGASPCFRGGASHRRSPGGALPAAPYAPAAPSPRRFPLVAIPSPGSSLSWQLPLLAAPSPGSSLSWKLPLLKAPSPGCSLSWKLPLRAAPSLGSLSWQLPLPPAVPSPGAPSPGDPSPIGSFSWRFPLVAASSHPAAPSLGDSLSRMRERVPEGRVRAVRHGQPTTGQHHTWPPRHTTYLAAQQAFRRRAG